MSFRVFCFFSVFALSVISSSCYAETVHVEGRASIEIRYTLAPRIIVGGEQAAEPEPYWVIVVQGGDGDQYELDEQFDLGEKNQPPSVLLQGKSVQANLGLSLDAFVRLRSGNYVWLSDATHVQSFQCTASALPVR